MSLAAFALLCTPKNSDQSHTNPHWYHCACLYCERGWWAETLPPGLCPACTVASALVPMLQSDVGALTARKAVRHG